MIAFYKYALNRLLMKIIFNANDKEVKRAKMENLAMLKMLLFVFLYEIYC
jgi:hypothetical protein